MCILLPARLVTSPIGMPLERTRSVLRGPENWFRPWLGVSTVEYISYTVGVRRGVWKILWWRYGPSGYKVPEK